MPKISIIMNCFNGERYVRDAIESVYAQDYQDWEIVFWDNASTDSTPEIAKSFDGRLRYFRADETTSLGQARALAFAEAKGDWVAILDYDDVMSPSRFDIQMAALGKGDYVLTYGGYREVDEQGKLLRQVMPRHCSGEILNLLLLNFEINITTVLMRRDHLMQIQPQKVAEFMMAEEYYYCLMLAARGQVCVVPSILASYRQVAFSWSERTEARHGTEFVRTLDELRQEYPGIEDRCSSGFSNAYARARYSDAKFLMQTGARKQARVILQCIGKIRRAYQILYWISFVPFLWSLVHRRGLKVRLTAWFFQ